MATTVCQGKKTIFIYMNFMGGLTGDTGLLLNVSEEKEVLGVGSVPVEILPSCQYITILHHICTDMNIVG